MNSHLSASLEADIVLIAGPTASGKSAAALALAQSCRQRERAPLLINADAMQVYDGLRILTARPMPEDERAVPHRLFGHVDPARRYSTGEYVSDVKSCLDSIGDERALPIFVGGTGLYFRALTLGLADIPRPPEDLVRHWKMQAKAVGAAALHAKLQALDPEAAANILSSDTQRIVRALAVYDSTGRSISDWQGHTDPGLLAGRKLARFALLPERDVLYRAIDLRFREMIEKGALQEVADFLERDLDPDLPAMKAIGVSELGKVLSGELELSAAIETAVTRTRQYAKRQLTWIRNQMSDWTQLSDYQ